MRAKFFTTTADRIEKTVNTWLEENNVELLSIKQSMTDGAFVPIVDGYSVSIEAVTVTVSLWFKEKETEI